MNVVSKVTWKSLVICLKIIILNLLFRWLRWSSLPSAWTRRPQGCCWCRGWRWLGLALALADRTSSCRSPSKQKATFFILKVSNQEEKITTKWKACFSPDTAGERQRRRTPNTAMVLIILIKVYFLYCNNMYFSNSCFCISILIYLVSTLNNEHANISGICAFLTWVLFLFGFGCKWNSHLLFNAPPLIKLSFEPNLSENFSTFGFAMQQTSKWLTRGRTNIKWISQSSRLN